MEKKFEVKKVNGTLKITTPYDETFIKRIKKLNGKWDSNEKAWVVDEDFEKKVNTIILDVYNVDLTESIEKISIEYNARDFFENDRIIVGRVITVYRQDRDSEVKLNDTAIIEGSFDKRGGSRGYPAVFSKDKEKDVILRTEMFKNYYDELSEEEKAKITIIKKENRKEVLEREKEALLKRLAEIESELKK